jgi:predicted thioesterase
MKETLVPGLSTTARIDIDTARTIDFMGEDGRVYATPELVRDIEMTTRDLLLRHADPGEDSVGTRVEIDHLSPTLAGMWVKLTVTVAEVDGRAVTFDVTGRDAAGDICKGRHARFMVDVEKTKQRLKKKAEAVAASAA